MKSEGSLLLTQSSPVMFIPPTRNSKVRARLAQGRRHFHSSRQWNKLEGFSSLIPGKKIWKIIRSHSMSQDQTWFSIFYCALHHEKITIQCRSAHFTHVDWKARPKNRSKSPGPPGHRSSTGSSPSWSEKWHMQGASDHNASCRTRCQVLTT